MKGRAFVSHYLSSTSLSWHPEESSFTSRRSYYKQATQKHARKRRTTLGVIQHWFHTGKEPEIPHTLHIYNITILCCEILSCEPMNRVVSCISHPWSSFKRKCSGLNYVLQESMCWGTWVARLVGKNVGRWLERATSRNEQWSRCMEDVSWERGSPETKFPSRNDFGQQHITLVLR